MEKKISYKYIITSVLLFFFFVLSILNNVKSMLYNCFNVMDFSVYQQPIYEMAKFVSFNPYSTVRDIHVLNDHFNPVLYMAVPFAWIFNYHPVGLLIFEWIWFASFLLIIIKLKKFSSLYEYLLCATMIIFSKALLSGLQFPIHPGMWSMPVWALLVYYIKKDNLLAILGISFLLCMYRESYPFAIVGLSGYYLFRKDWKKFLSIFLLGTLLTIFIYKIRPLFMGEVYDYGGKITAGFAIDPIGEIFRMFRDFKYMVLFKIFYPFLIPLVWIFKKEVKGFNHYIFPVLFMLAPLFAVHFLANKFYFHYGIAFAAPTLMLIILSGFPKALVNNKKLAGVVIVLFIVSSMSVYSKMVKLVFFNKTNSCTISKSKKLATKLLLKNIGKIMPELTNGKTIIATGGVVPRVLLPNMNIYNMRNKSRKLPSYNYMLMERSHKGVVHPISGADLIKIEKLCSEYATETIQADKHYWLAKGPFPGSCIFW